jgi:hypothetical protein
MVSAQDMSRRPVLHERFVEAIGGGARGHLGRHVGGVKISRRCVFERRKNFDLPVAEGHWMYASGQYRGFEALPGTSASTAGLWALIGGASCYIAIRSSQHPSVRCSTLSRFAVHWKSMNGRFKRLFG